jgi:hypothetical protein
MKKEDEVQKVYNNSTRTTRYLHRFYLSSCEDIDELNDLLRATTAESLERVHDLTDQKVTHVVDHLACECDRFYCGQLYE